MRGLSAVSGDSVLCSKSTVSHQRANSLLFFFFSRFILFLDFFFCCHGFSCWYFFPFPFWRNFFLFDYLSKALLMLRWSDTCIYTCDYGFLNALAAIYKCASIYCFINSWSCKYVMIIFLDRVLQFAWFPYVIANSQYMSL